MLNKTENEIKLYKYKHCGIQFIMESVIVDGTDSQFDIAADTEDTDFYDGCFLNSGHFFDDKRGLARVRARDLVLYSHWPIKTKRYFEILESETTDG